MVENLPWCTSSQKCGTCCYKDDGVTTRYLACSSAPWNDKTGFSKSGCDAAKSNYYSKAASKLTKRCTGLNGETLRQCLHGVGSGKTAPKLPLSKRAPLNIKGSGGSGLGTGSRGGGSTGLKRLTSGQGRGGAGVTGSGQGGVTLKQPPTNDAAPTLPSSSTDQPEDFFANNGIFIIAALAIVVLLVVL